MFAEDYYRLWRVAEVYYDHDMACTREEVALARTRERLEESGSGPPNKRKRLESGRVSNAQNVQQVWSSVRRWRRRFVVGEMGREHYVLHVVVDHSAWDK